MNRGTPGIECVHVWKKFRRGEHHDSLRDLIPAFTRRLVGRGPGATDLDVRDFWVLRDLTFEVKPGEALGVIGPNGAGKSTLLKLLTRILRPNRGRVAVRGRIGALIEVAAGFHPDLTGRENVFLQGAIMGMRRAEIAAKFDEILAFSGVEDFIDTPVKRYSSGMNARLGFSIAAHLDPDVLVIDEVLAVGDMAFQQRCYQRLSHFREQGIPIAFVSHNMQAVASICDRGLLLRPGLPPRLDSVAGVISEYVGGMTVSADPRVEILEARLLLEEGERPVDRPLRPGTPLVLAVELRALEPLPACAVSLVVSRSDGMLMFDGLTAQHGGEVDVAPGDRLSLRVRFEARMLRGTYSVGVVLVERMRRWPNLRLAGLGTFVIEERTRNGGFVELEPTAEVDVVSAAAAGRVGQRVTL